jgi:RNA polymerase sigma-70 factor (ECF subfamily)
MIPSTHQKPEDTMSQPASSSPLTPAEFEAMLQTIRPELHRYATRMTGSVIDGEDVVQEALVKAYYSLSLLTHNTNVRGWLFRITHNKAIDLLRRHSDQPMERLDEYPMIQELDAPLEDKELTTFALSMFLKLPPRQRSCVILKDVLGYSLAEISELLNATVPEIKATLHRGRTRLRELGQHAEISTPALNKAEQERLFRYVDHFNAYDFEALRRMLTDEATVDLVGRTKVVGAAAMSDQYYHRYALTDNWTFGVGTVDGRLAVLCYDRDNSTAPPIYCVLITWEGERITQIRDYLFARHIMIDAAITRIAAPLT